MRDVQDVNKTEEVEQTADTFAQERVQNLEEEKKKQRQVKRNWFAGGVIAGLVISLFAFCTAYLITGFRGIGAGLVGERVAKTDSQKAVLNSVVAQKINLLEDSIRQYYLEDVTNEEMELGLYRGLVQSMGDPYSSYYTIEEVDELRESTEGIYYGIGAYVGMDQKTGYCKITGTIKDTPAEKSGLQAEDLIVKVDGQDTQGMDTTDVVALIKGEENTDVVITVYRNGENDYLDFTVTRKKVEAPTVNYEMMEDGMAYIQITQFEQVSPNQFKQALESAREDGMKGLILDLRSNPGGTLMGAVEIARQMLPEGMIVYTEDKYGEREEYTGDGKHQLEVPLVVLVNDNSASASEILAGAIKDYGIGTLVGTTTYGKGIVQKVFGITDGSAVKLTISHYYTPKGNDIHEVGIVPDEEVELDVEKYVEDGSDNQLDRAKEILAGEMKE